MYGDWMNDMPIVIGKEEIKDEEIKLSLKDKFALWLLTL